MSSFISACTECLVSPTHAAHVPDLLAPFTVATSDINNIHGINGISNLKHQRRDASAVLDHLACRRFAGSLHVGRALMHSSFIQSCH